ncbi:MAG: Holliday junction branch migration protein RuvA [Thainema sp.]
MLSFLTGAIAGVQKTPSNRVMLLLDVNGVGYELQITSRFSRTLPDAGETAQVHCHLQVREDQMILYGFESRAERDVFRQLTSVSGIGAQLAIALLDTLGLQDMVQAIVTSNTRRLAQTPGVGNKTAERLCLELKAKLAEWRTHTGMSTSPSAAPTPSLQEDIEMTLLALGYTQTEIQTALQTVGQQTALSKSGDAEQWIRAAIAWLSQ